MRCSSISSIFLLALPLSAYALSILDWFSPRSPPSSSTILSSEVVPHRIAIIGAGAGGSSAAFWAAKARARAGIEAEIDVYERENYIGGRSTTVYPFNDPTLPPVEVGASIFVPANKNIWRASEEFNLTRIPCDFIDKSSQGIWDGSHFVITLSGQGGLNGWIDKLKALWRYGYISPKKVDRLVKYFVNNYLSLYTSSSSGWSSIEELSVKLNTTDAVTNTAADYLSLYGVSYIYSHEVIEAATRVNYGQNIDRIDGMGALVSLAATDASSIAGGNYRVFQHFLGHSGANVRLNTTIISIIQESDLWILMTSSGETKTYKDVILAAPYHSTDIKISASSESLLSMKQLLEVPAQPYVHLHVTLLSTSAKHPDAVYFGLKPGSTVPTTILTTFEAARNGGKAPEFNSLSYHGPVAPGKDEYIVKIFSKETVSDKWLNTVFGGKVGWVYRREFDAYPVLHPTTTFPPVVLSKGLYYVNSLEPFISTMETETLSSRNIVNQLFQARFGVDICGKRINTESSERMNGSDAENDQEVLQKDPEVRERKSGQPQTPMDESFVFGWDCP